jgi:hypothetical protein
LFRDQPPPLRPRLTPTLSHIPTVSHRAGDHKMARSQDGRRVALTSDVYFFRPESNMQTRDNLTPNRM